MALESEFDRFLLTADGEAAPHTYDHSRRFKLTRGECMTVAEFYPPATGANISQCVKLMAFCSKFLAHPNRAGREKLLKKIDPSLCDQFIPEAEVEELALYVQELNALFDQAQARYPLLLEQLTAHMRSGEALGEDFAPNFG